jgi:hypothetical protein
MNRLCSRLLGSVAPLTVRAEQPQHPTKDHPRSDNREDDMCLPVAALTRRMTPITTATALCTVRYTGQDHFTSSNLRPLLVPGRSK